MTQLHKLGGKFGIAMVAIFLLANSSNTAFAIEDYSIQGIDNFLPTAINNASEVVGEPQDSVTYATLWSAGAVTEIAPAGLTSPLATDINSSGEVIGIGTNTQEDQQGFLWQANTGFLNVNVPTGRIAAFTALNSLGQFGGYTEVENVLESRVACLWTSPNNPVSLPLLNGSNDSRVVALNDNLQAVGTSGLVGNDFWPSDPHAPYAQEHAVLWQNGNVIDLTPNDPWSNTVGINNSGQVIGWLIDPKNGESRAFEWSAEQGLVDLPSGYAVSVSAINNEGQIVGSMLNATGDSTLAVIWDQGILYDLNTLLPADSGWILKDATGINDLGQIVGGGTYDGQEEAFLLTPIGTISVPEPAAISLVAGFSLLATRRRRTRFCR